MERTAENWKSFASEYILDEKYGCLIPPDYNVETFNFELLRKANAQIEKMGSDEEVFSVVESFPDLELKGTHNLKDLIILHDYIISVLSPFLSRKRKALIPQSEIKIPKNLAEPLFISSNTLGFKYGMNSHSFFNWRPINDNYLKDDTSFGMSDICLGVYMTSHRQQQLLFFGGLIVASFYIARMIKIAFEINQIIQHNPTDFESVSSKLDLCATYWQKIAKENQIVANEFEPGYFNNELRPELRGFNVIFQGVDNGNDLLISTHGGTAGNDPSFQMFQFAFGITSKGLYHKMQLDLREGMAKKHIQCLFQLEKHSLIRQYCSQCGVNVKSKYNKMIKAYGNFLRIHSIFLSKFILLPAKMNNPEKKQTEQKGTAGTAIMEIIMRYEDVESQILKI